MLSLNRENQDDGDEPAITIPKITPTPCMVVGIVLAPTVVGIAVVVPIVVVTVAVAPIVVGIAVVVPIVGDVTAAVVVPTVGGVTVAVPLVGDIRIQF